MSIVFAELSNRSRRPRLNQLDREQFRSNRALVARRTDDDVLVHLNRKVPPKFPIPYDRAR